MAIAVCLVAALGFATLTAAPAQAAAGVSSSVFSLTNAQRTKAGLKPLISDATLDAAAKAWAQQLASSCTFKHSTASWRTSRTAKAGWTATGENIAAGYTSASAVMSGWMGSSGHKANILNKSYTGLGVGYATGSCGYKTYWVQIFGVGKTAGPAGAGDVNGDATSDVVAHKTPYDLAAYPGNGAGGWKTSSVVDSTWASNDRLLTLGDFNGDSRTDVARIRPNGAFELFKGNGTGGYAGAVAIGNGWNTFTDLVGGVDFDGDGRTDVLARDAAGNLRLYRGNGAGGWLGGSGKQIGNGWNIINRMFYAGDFNGDGKGDILARRTNGTLWLYPTTGTGKWGAARQIGTGWQGMTALFSPGDFSGDGKSDVLARASDGTLWLYRGNGKGGWGTRTAAGQGWGGVLHLG
jgi:hypothetical protein